MSNENDVVDEVMGTMDIGMVHIEQEDDPLFPLCGRPLRSGALLVADPNKTSYNRCPDCVAKWDRMVPTQSKLSEMMAWLDDEEENKEDQADPSDITDNIFSTPPASFAELYGGKSPTGRTILAPDIMEYNRDWMRLMRFYPEKLSCPVCVVPQEQPVTTLNVDYSDLELRILADMVSKNDNRYSMAAPIRNRSALSINVLLAVAGYEDNE